MRRRPHRIACLLAAAALALPATAWGQSAGDEQYEDPFAPAPGQTDQEGSTGGGDTGSSDGGSSGGGTVEPAPTAAPEVAPAAPPATTTTTAAEQELPRTGADAGLLALAGAVLLAGGVALRVKLSARGPRRR
jgi:LPXTG-motif cell wall-anchored protein